MGAPLTSYQQQLQQKVSLTENEFAEVYHDTLEVYASPAEGYRMRAEFKAWQENGAMSYAMYRQGEYKKPYTIDTFAAGSTTMQRLMPLLREAVNASEQLRHKLFQVEFLTTTTGQAVITLIYHKPLTDCWLQAATTIAQTLEVNLIGRSRKQKLVIGNDYVIEKMRVAGKSFDYQQVEGSFTQPNAFICEAMLNWVERQVEPRGDLLELYCGNGNFTLPLAQRFQRVLATEVSKTSIKSALTNCEMNAVNNIAFVRMSSEEITQALNGERPFRRLQNIDLDSYNFSTVFVDPPRAGLDLQTNKLVQRFDQIVYVSCNPKTLKENLQQLTATHRVVRMALFDQFPFTPHRECGVVLAKR